MLKKVYQIIKKYINSINRYIELKKVASHKDELFIGGRTSLTKNTKLGRNPNFNGMKILGFGKVEFGDNFHSGSGCQIITSIHNYDNGNSIPYDESTIDKNVYIGDNVWFGNNVTVLGGVKIGEGAIIQACALVYKDIPKYAIVGGNPAVIIKKRDSKHYEKLKAKKKFM